MIFTSQQSFFRSMLMNDQEEARIGHYSLAALLLIGLAYFLDEQRRLRAHSSLLMLQDKNSALAEGLIRWKVLVGDIETASVEVSGRSGVSYSGIQQCALTEHSSIVPEHSPLRMSSLRNDLHPAFAAARACHHVNWEDELSPGLQSQQHPWAGSTLAPTTRPRVQPDSPTEPLAAHTHRLQAGDRQSSPPELDILDVIE
mmetsp:Transcript_8649/g.15821  ORF Transcript_8649/g.15821 Transcript_8649/m.15821 type:complete len:200 (-) Transcript_8649:166-765(-)